MKDIMKKVTTTTEDDGGSFLGEGLSALMQALGGMMPMNPFAQVASNFDFDSLFGGDPTKTTKTVKKYNDVNKEGY